MPATRVEIAEAVADAFAEGPQTSEDLLAQARRVDARTEVIQILERLPHGPFIELRQLWNTLPDVPIEPLPTDPI